MNDEHKRLEQVLIDVALTNGMQFDGNWDGPGNPDIYRISSGGLNLFVGDAKDVNSDDTASNPETWARVKRYFDHLLNKADGDAGFSVFAIATNTADAASEWKNAIDNWASEAGMKTLDATIDCRDQTTYIIELKMPRSGGK